MQSRRSTCQGILMLATCSLLSSACGGSGGQSDLYGTWSWNGSRWTQLAKTIEGKTFVADRLFYSAELGGLIDLNGTRWDGAGWAKSDLVPASAPVGGTQSTAYVVDDASGQLLFLDPNAATMWAWSRRSWAAVVSPTAWPEARYLSSGGVAFDPYRKEVLIVTAGLGGLETSGWDGHTITTLERHSALPQLNLLIVPDGLGHMLAFGQDDAGGSPTVGFSWDGKTWSPLASTTRLPKGVISVAFAPADQKIVAIGSDDGANFHTWRWNADAWQLVATATSPPGGKISDLVYDPDLPGFVIKVLPAQGLGGII